MSTGRQNLGPDEVVLLHARLGRQLERIGIETQPKVAARLLELSRKADAQIREYHDAIRVDWALTGRILKLANSAYYAQRGGVTKLDRALVILGVDRARAVSLGFYLSRALSAGGSRAMSRQVWGQSIYRANLCSAMAKVCCPQLTGEAFVVGLMLDCGQPLMARMMGEKYEEIHAGNAHPQKLYLAEFQTLEFTHVDVVVALMRRWAMPALLAGPICDHHFPPEGGRTSEPQTMLHRLAYYAGAVQLEAGSDRPGVRAPMSTIAQRLFEMPAGELEYVVKAAGLEYQATIGLFEDVADQVEKLDELSDDVQMQLVDMFDVQMEKTVKADKAATPLKLLIAGQNVEIEPRGDGEVIAYISGSSGERLVTCTLNPAHESTESIARMLGLEDAPEPELVELARVIHELAA